MPGYLLGANPGFRLNQTPRSLRQLVCRQVGDHPPLWLAWGTNVLCWPSHKRGEAVRRVLRLSLETAQAAAVALALLELRRRTAVNLGRVRRRRASASRSHGRILVFCIGLETGVGLAATLSWTWSEFGWDPLRLSALTAFFFGGLQLVLSQTLPVILSKAFRAATIDMLFGAFSPAASRSLSQSAQIGLYFAVVLVLIMAVFWTTFIFLL